MDAVAPIVFFTNAQSRLFETGSLQRISVFFVECDAQQKRKNSPLNVKHHLKKKETCNLRFFLRKRIDAGD